MGAATVDDIIPIYNFTDEDVTMIKDQRNRDILAEIHAAQTKDVQPKKKRMKKAEKVLKPSNAETQTATHVSRSGRVTKRLVLGSKTSSTPVCQTHDP